MIHGAIFWFAKKEPNLLLFLVDAIFVSVASELPDIASLDTINSYQKGHKRLFNQLSKKIKLMQIYMQMC